VTQNKLTAWWSEKSKALYRKLNAKIVSAETSVNIVYRKPSSHVGISHFFEKRFDMQRSSPTMKSYGVLLPLLKVLTGCLATPIKPSSYKIAEIRTILVVPVASPPLEVIPDLIETRFPVYHHYQAMPFYPYLVEKIYNNPGGVLIAGLVSKDGNVPVAELLQTSPSMEKFASLEPTTSLPEYWTPTFLLVKEAILQLNVGRVQSNTEQALLSPSHCHWRSQRQSR